ncbi:hypothetical protein GQ600_22883 [Phytophthora cactorum]|nr:hypothetical protein GQ600_22883 [Phytophthora cactorum]
MPRTSSSDSAGADSDDERTAAPIFTPVRPPRLTSTSHAALVKWRRERREYEETIRSRAKDNSGDLIVPVRSTFDEGLLRMWCLLRWKMPIDESRKAKEDEVALQDLILAKALEQKRCTKPSNAPSAIEGTVTRGAHQHVCHPSRQPRRREL